jgi:hypothetical protein
MDRIVLENFVRAGLELTDAFETDCNLNDLDRFRLENYMFVIQMAYINWKRRNVASNPTSPAYKFGKRNR